MKRERTVKDGRQAKKNPGRQSGARLTIGLILDLLGLEYQMSVRAGVADLAKDLDANLVCFAGGVLLYPTEFGSQRNAIYNLVNEANVDGLVIQGSLGQFVGPEERRDFYKHFRPLPMVNVSIPVEGVPSVLVDNEQGTRDALLHLIEVHGYRRIAFIQGPEGNQEAEQRYRVYREALADHGLAFDPDLVAPGIFEPSSGIEAVRLLCDERKADFEALVASNDYAALGALQELRARGIRVPHDVAVVGFDDIEEARACTPALTTVQQPMYDLGWRAVEMLLAQLRGESVPEEVLLPTRLVVRRSCGCFSQIVVQATAGPKPSAQSAAQPTREAANITLADYRELIVREIVQAVHAPTSGQKMAMASTWAERLLDTFAAEINGEAPGHFLLALDDVLSQVTAANGDLTLWQGALSILRRHVLACLVDNETQAQAENLWQQARVLVGEAIQQAEAYRRFQAERQADVIRRMSYALITTFDVAELMVVMARELPILGIPGCHLALYEGQQVGGSTDVPCWLEEGQPAPPEWSRLILSYDEKGQAMLDAGGQRFPTLQLVPENRLPSERRYCFVAEPLFFGNHHLGFVLFEMGPREGGIYEALRGQLSGALEGALLVQRMRKQEKEHEHLLADLESQASENVRLYQAERARYREAEALRQAALVLTSTTDLDQVFERILVGLQNVVPYDSASVQLLKEDQLEIIGVRGFPNLPERLGICIPVHGDNPNAIVLKSRETVIIANAQERYPAAFSQEPHAAADIRGWLGVPLLVGDRLIGMLALDKHEADFFTETHARAAKAYAAQAAVAIENARLYKDLQDQMRAVELAQARLVQSEKLAAIGELVAGVAHELNNPLTSIIGYAQLMQTGQISDQAQQDVAKIVAQSRRAAGIVRSLLDFARQRPSERKLVQINDILISTIELLTYELRTHNIEWAVHFSPDLPPTLADPYQLQRVFVNLVHNARQAMNETHGTGHLTLTTESGPPKFVNNRREAAPVIRVIIQDDGPGIPSELLSRIFDPFFTTKPPGEGTGLGLSVCHGIVSEHGGHIWAESGPEGASFFVELPTATPKVSPPPQAGPPPPKLPADEGKASHAPAHILMIDDEVDLLTALTLALRHEGYRVDPVSDGKTALARLAETHYDLILCDVRIPGLDGPEIYRQAKATHPDMDKRIIFITGDTVSTATRRFLEESGAPYLDKPFELDDLIKKVSATLKSNSG
jgi:DNA-binding LacI/PurR family transcriptional regulator/signal transduction histidine kinase/ActR/RegA family two-component response regulator